MTWRFPVERTTTNLPPRAVQESLFDFGRIAERISSDNLSVTEGRVDLSGFAGEFITSISFENPSSITAEIEHAAPGLKDEVFPISARPIEVSRRADAGPPRLAKPTR